MQSGARFSRWSQIAASPGRQQLLHHDSPDVEDAPPNVSVDLLLTVLCCLWNGRQKVLHVPG
eukprot:scaffold6219_cov153-Pinguiococcus_pyrenoidosus.AAC.2